MNASRKYSVAHLLMGMLLAAMAPCAWAAESEGGNVNAIGHSADGYYLDFSPFGIVELPRILVVRQPDGSLGLDVFASTHAAIEHGGYVLVAREDQVLTAGETEQAVLAHQHLYYGLQPAEGDVVLDLSVTRQQVFVLLVALLLLVIGLRLGARYKKGYGRSEAPRGVWQNMMEALIVFIREDIAKPSIGDAYPKYLPYLLSVFIFITLGNLIGLVPWGVTATSNIMVTGTLALFTFVLTQVAGTKAYWTHILWPPDVPVPIKFILIPIEVIGMFTKPLALAFRLFGNMVSGHLVIVSILGLIFIFTAQFNAWAGVGVAAIASVPLTIFIYLLKILVSLVQAYIFTMLSAIFIGMAAAEHHHEEPHQAVVPEPAEPSELSGPNLEEILQGDGQPRATQPTLAS